MRVFQRQILIQNYVHFYQIFRTEMISQHGVDLFHGRTMIEAHFHDTIYEIGFSRFARKRFHVFIAGT